MLAITSDDTLWTVERRDDGLTGRSRIERQGGSLWFWRTGRRPEKVFDCAP